MIGVTAGAGALVFLSRGDVSDVDCGGRSRSASLGERRSLASALLPHANVQALRLGFVIMIMIAIEMGWRAGVNL